VSFTACTFCSCIYQPLQAADEKKVRANLESLFSLAFRKRTNKSFILTAVKVCNDRREIKYHISANMGKSHLE
jgi:hypothetical protein